MDKYEIHVDDNFHYMDESYRFKEGEYDTYDEALAICKEIVDRSLALNYREGMSSNQLWECYVSYGVDPFIPRSGDDYFSARSYAKEICMKNIESVKRNHASADSEAREIMARDEAFDEQMIDILGDTKGVGFVPRVKRH